MTIKERAMQAIRANPATCQAYSAAATLQEQANLIAEAAYRLGWEDHENEVAAWTREPFVAD